MKKVICTICLLMLTGCSTIMNGPTQEIKVTSNPPGAIITTTAFEWIKTPGTIKLPRANSTTLTANLFGYEEMKQEMKVSLSPWVAGNAVGQFYPWTFMGQASGVVALTILDLSTGSIGTLSPAEVHFELVPKKK